MASADKHMTNYARLGHAAQELLPELLRELVSIKEPTKNLIIDCKTNKYLSGPNGLKPPEWLLVHNVAINEYSKFDVPLLYKLIRNLNLVQRRTLGWDYPSDPKPTELNMGDDVERIRRKRNEILHKGVANVSDDDLAEYFTLFKDIARRFEIYLSLPDGHFVSRFKRLETCCMDPEAEKQFLQKLKEFAEKEKDIIEEIKQIRTDVEHLKIKDQQESKLILPSDELQTLKEMLNLAKMAQILSDTHRRPHKGLFQSYISDWLKDEKYFVETRAAKSILGDIVTKKCIVVTGCPGSGKSAIVHHTALYLQTVHGYEIVPSVIEPFELMEYMKEGEKQVFIMDDVFGKVSVNSHIVDKWILHIERIEKILNFGNVKLLIACRLQIIKDPLIQNLRSLMCNQYDLQRHDLCLLKEERVSIAEKYLSKDVIGNISEILEEFDFFPLLCKLFLKNKDLDPRTFFRNPIEVIKHNITEMKEQTNKMMYCAFTLCVLYNDRLQEDWFEKDHEQEKYIRSICDDIGIDLSINRKSLKQQLNNLENTHIRKLNGCFSLIHDALFDVAATICGQDLLQCFIDVADVTFIGERYQLESLNKHFQDCIISIPKSSEIVYFKRLLKDLINGKTYSTFQNRQLQFATYREKLVSFLFQNDNVVREILLKFDEIQFQNIERKTRENELHNFYISDDDCDINSAYTSEQEWNYKDISLPLLEASSQGYTDIVKLLLNMGCNVNIYDNHGRTAVYMAVLHGHAQIVRFLLNKGAISSICDRWERSPLYIACEKGNEKIVQLLLHGSSISKSDSCFFKTPLHVACERGHIAIVQTLLENGTDVTQTNSDGHSPLYVACDYGHTQLVDVLLQFSCDVNQCDEKDRTPLFVSCKNGHKDIVKLLLASNADASISDTDGLSPLHVSCKWGHTDIVHLLLQENIDIDNSDRYYGRTPLFLAFEGKHEDVIKLLIQHGSNIYHCNKRKQSLLYIACKNDLESTVQLVLQLMPDHYVLSFNYGDWSPLIAACESGNTSIVNMLLERKMYINIRNQDGQCPLHIACEQGLTDLVQILLSNACDINCLEEVTGRSALFIACEEGFLDIVKLLIDYGADHKNTAADGSSPFFIACSQGQSDIVQLLIQLKADTWASDEDFDCSPLFVACMGGHTQTVHILLTNGADVNKCDKKKCTPLHIASKEGHYNVVKLLLEHGANPHIRNYVGKLPIDLARSSFRTKVVELLEQTSEQRS